MTPEEKAALLAEFDRLADAITSPENQMELERRVHERLAAENRWHNQVLPRELDPLRSSSPIGETIAYLR